MAGRCLIVANQTLGGEALESEVKSRINRGVGFHVVVPVTRVEHETSGWTGGFAYTDGVTYTKGGKPAQARAAAEQAARRHQSELQEAQRRAEQRLGRMLEKIESLGGEATGQTGSDDPLAAARTVLEREPHFDEIIVSTLPARLSRWLKMDLPNRLARAADVPVTTVEAQGDVSA